MRGVGCLRCQGCGAMRWMGRSRGDYKLSSFYLGYQGCWALKVIGMGEWVMMNCQVNWVVMVVGL